MRAFLAFLLAFAPAAASAAPVRLECIAWGGSHTGRYTFTVDAESCGVYWHQLDRSLAIQSCDPPRIVAVKPFAVGSGYVLEFNLETGRFEDHTPAWSDRGRCERAPDGAK